MSCDDELDADHLALDSPEFSRQLLEVAPGRELPLDAPAWRDAIVFLSAGEIELECVSGRRRRFARDAILCLPPTVRLLRNSSAEPALLIAVRRNRDG